MTDHLLLTSFDRDCAVLNRKDGTTVSLPVEWLPEEAREGMSLRVTMKPGPGSSAVSFEIDEGNTEPEGVNVGG